MPGARTSSALSPYSGSIRIAVAYLVSTSGDFRLEGRQILRRSRAALAAPFGDSLLERAALVHSRCGDHTLFVGTCVYAVELASGHSNLSQGNLLMRGPLLFDHAYR